MLIFIVSYKFLLNQNSKLRIDVFNVFFSYYYQLCNQYFCEANLLTVALINNHDKSVNIYLNSNIRRNLPKNANLLLVIDILLFFTLRTVTIFAIKFIYVKHV